MMQHSVEQTSYSQSEFVSVPSKGRLWKILQDNGAFNGINNSFFTKVREDFEIGVVRIEEEHRDKPIMVKSKLFIDMMIEKMKEYKHFMPQMPIQQVQQVQQVKQAPSAPYTAQDIKKSRLDAFDNELSRKQNEFNQFNAKPTPPHVDFADKKEDDDGDVNKLLEKAMRERENLEIPKLANEPMPTKTKTDTTPITMVVEEKKPELNLETLTRKVNQNEQMLNKIMEKLTSIEELLKKENKSD